MVISVSERHMREDDMVGVILISCHVHILQSELTPLGTQTDYVTHLEKVLPGTKTALNVPGMGSEGSAGTNKVIVYFPSEWRSHCHASLCGTIDERANIAQRLQSAKESVYLPHKVR